MSLDPTADSARRSKTEAPAAVDVAIIGAGLGGLMAGARLAKAGLRVALFESHYVAGGCATQFRRRGEGGFYHFDVGLHYIGDCEEGGGIPRILDQVGVKLRYRPMDQQGFDVLKFPGLTFPTPVGHDAYEKRLLETFPSEQPAIAKYLRFLREVDHVVRYQDKREGPPDLRMAWEVLRHGRMVMRYMQKPIAAVLEDCRLSPRARGVVLGPHGDYGLPPSRVSALLHAGLVNHYLHGAYYPEGGGQVIADRLAATIEEAGGVILLRRPIAQIVVEGGRAVGIRTEATKRTPATEVRAKAVLSNADLKKTWLELLEPGSLGEQARQQADAWEMAGALFMTCLGVRGDLRELGMSDANYWIFDTFDIESVYRDCMEAERARIRGIYVTSASLKDPGTQGHAPDGYQTLEIMTLVPGQPGVWGVPSADATTWSYRHDEAYAQAKQHAEDQVLAMAEEHFPGLGARIVYQESATPLTHARFTRASGGTGYGLACTPEQFMRGRPGYRGPVPGLYQCGASTRAGHGIVGALRSGSQAAQRLAKDLGVSL